MDEFIEFFSTYSSECFSVFAFLVSFLFNLVMWFRTRNIKYLKEGIMKYRTDSYRAEDSEAQTFVSLKPIFRLNKSSGLLEKTDDFVDIQSEIDSMKDYCLKACLERFEAFYSSDDDAILSELNSYQDDIDSVNSMLSVAENYREKLGLSDDASVSEIFSAMQHHAQQLNKTIQNKKKQQLNCDVSDSNNGGQSNEKV